MGQIMAKFYCWSSVRWILKTRNFRANADTFCGSDVVKDAVLMRLHAWPQHFMNRRYETENSSRFHHIVFLFLFKSLHCTV
jgi:hypothetical protein